MHSQNPSAPLPNSPGCLHLPEEIIEDIVSKLPVKSLLRFRCVSISWLSLVESNRFINKHLKTSTKDANWAHHRLFFHIKEGVMKGCSLPSLLNSALPSSINPYPLINKMRNRMSPAVMGSCKGVLCLLYSTSYSRTTFSLSNPATRVSMELPQLPGNAFSKFGFGWDESSGAFKVFVCSYDYSLLGNVYSSKTNSWKTVPFVSSSSSLYGLFGASAGGRLHWDTGIDHEYVIESFNLENDKFGRIELPPSYADANANAYEGDRPPYKLLGEIGGCLCALFDYKKTSIEVWVMREYGVKDSWIKLLTFPHAAHSVFRQLGEGPNGEIFVIYSNTLAVYSSEGDDISSRATATKIDLIYSYIPAGIYVESLVSPTGLLLV